MTELNGASLELFSIIWAFQQIGSIGWCNVCSLCPIVFWLMVALLKLFCLLEGSGKVILYHHIFSFCVPMSSHVLLLRMNWTTASKVLKLAGIVQPLHTSSLQMIPFSFSKMTLKPFPPFNKPFIGTVTYLAKSSVRISLNFSLPQILVMKNNKS